MPSPKRDDLADACGVHRRHQPLDVRRGEPRVRAGHERRLQEREEPPVHLAQRRGAGRHPGVELGGPEPVGGQHAVDAERAAVAVLTLQVRAHATGGAPHRLAVCRRRVPGAAQPGVGHRARRRVAQRDDLDGPQHRRTVGQHEPVDRARHALEERQHPHPVAAWPEERRGRGPVAVVAQPAHEVATAVEAVAGVAGPHRAQLGPELRCRLVEGGVVGQVDDAVRRPLDARRRPRSASASSLSSRARNDAGRPPVTGLPSTGSSVVTNGVVYQIPRRSGSNASTAARRSAGSRWTIRSWSRTSSVSEAVAGRVQPDDLAAAVRRDRTHAAARRDHEHRAAEVEEPLDDAS